MLNCFVLEVFVSVALLRAWSEAGEAAAWAAEEKERLAAAAEAMKPERAEVETRASMVGTIEYTKESNRVGMAA